MKTDNQRQDQGGDKTLTKTDKHGNLKKILTMHKKVSLVRSAVWLRLAVHRAQREGDLCHRYIYKI